MLAPNTLLQQDRYRILDAPRKGNMGAVYLAYDAKFCRKVALKETFFTSDDALLRDQFYREARLLAILRHTSLPIVLDHFIEGSGQFLVMDYIIGKDLRELLEENASPFPVNTVLDWADQLLDVLIYLHTQEYPVVHRDIKPANIKVTPQGRVILLDFGLAKGGTSSMLISLLAATKAYAPIEQVLGQGTDPRSDLYSLGATLYHLLTNTFPPSAQERQETLRRGLPDPLPPAGEVNAKVPEPIARLLTEAMALTADDRLPTAARMRELLCEARLAFETTLPFSADQRSRERKLAPEDLPDDAVNASGESELKAENPPVKPAEGSRALNVVDNMVSQASGLQAPAQFVMTPSALRRWLVAFGIAVLIALTGIGVWRSLRSGKAAVPETYTETAGGAPIEMVRLSAGRFLMGSSDSEPGRYTNEGPQHMVSMASFYAGKYEVTQSQWRAVATGLPQVNIDLKPDPSHFKADNLPVEQVSWAEAREFCERISSATGKKYRLPTEAEWEYACRATTTGSYADDLDAMAWCADNSRGKTHPVGLKWPNGFGLYDMHGNVWEWCMDTWHESYYGAPTDGTAWTGGDGGGQALRGGSWLTIARDCRSAFRVRKAPDNSNSLIGFRVVTSAPTP